MRLPRFFKRIPQINMEMPRVRFVNDPTPTPTEGFMWVLLLFASAKFGSWLGTELNRIEKLETRLSRTTEDLERLQSKLKKIEDNAARPPRPTF